MDYDLGVRVWGILLVGLAACEGAEPRDEELACERPSDCVITRQGCCGTDDARTVAVRADAERAFLERSCPDDPHGTAPRCLAVCPSYYMPVYAVATCSAGRCEAVSFRDGDDARELRSCDVDGDCTSHDRCARIGIVDCRMPVSVLEVAIARDAVETYEALAGCSGGEGADVACVDGLCELGR